MKTNKTIAARIRKLDNASLVWSHNDCAQAVEALMSVDASNAWKCRAGGEKLMGELILLQAERSRRGI